MSNKSIQLFGSKEYRFLNWLKGQEQTTSRGATINFSQEEIAAEYGSSPATVNKLYGQGLYWNNRHCCRLQ